MNYTLSLWPAGEKMSLPSEERVVPRAKAPSAGLRNRRQKKSHLMPRRSGLKWQDQGWLDWKLSAGLATRVQGLPTCAHPRPREALCVDQTYATGPDKELRKGPCFRPQTLKSALSLILFFLAVWSMEKWVNPMTPLLPTVVM